MFVHTRHHGQQRVPFFGCSTYHLRGRTICENNLEVPLEAIDRAVLDAIEHNLLRVEVLETALAKGLDLLRPHADALKGTSQRLRDELAPLDVELSR
jgi:recombinase-like zinc beta ribbon protein